MTPRSIQQMLADAKPGHCVMCEAPVPKRKRKPRRSENASPRPRRTCGHPECMRGYLNLYTSAIRAEDTRVEVIKTWRRVERLIARACKSLEARHA